MKIYEGVVEDINDPLKVGRVRVRVFGLHTDDKNLIPTDALPWAKVQMSTTFASMSGIGTMHGLLQGSWVTLYFKDKDEQYPVVLGSLLGVPVNTNQVATEEFLEFSDSEAVVSENVLKDSSGQPVVDSSNKPIKTEPVVVPDTIPKATNSKVISSELGSVSSKYESNGNPGTINKYASGVDLGGASYGAYQFASYLKAENTPTRTSVTQAQIKNSPVMQYIRTSQYASQFSGLTPATTAFDSVWKEIAKSDRSAFLADQHKYIERNYYQVAASKCKTSVTNRGKAIHEAIWSMSVQLGTGGAASKINTVIGNVAPDVCDDKTVSLLYDSRIDTVQSDFKSSPGLWNGLIKRFKSEKSDLMKLAATYQTGTCASAITTVVEEKTVYKEDQKKEIVKEEKTIAVQSTKKIGDRGFGDPDKEFPLYYNEADTHRLIRGIITGTIVDAKRSGTISGQEAGDTTISEPVTQYNTKYPYNKVFATRSGHIIELDDTPGYERIHVYHKSGTFVEFYPDGKLVTKVRDTNTTVVNLDNNTITMGDSNIHTENNSNETVYGNKKLIVYGNLNIEVNGDCNTTVTGSASIKASIINLN